MPLESQIIIPIARHIADFEKILETKWQYIIVMGSHVAQLTRLVKIARKADKLVLLHADSIQGLKNNNQAAEFLCNDVHPDGLISTHHTVISVAKANRILSIQPIFLLDSHALETSLRILKHSEPDYVEVLPGIMPSVIETVRKRIDFPILASGFIRTPSDVEAALAAGASGVATSARELWSERPHKKSARQSVWQYQ